MIRFLWMISSTIVVLASTVIIARSNAEEVPYFTINEVATVIVCSSAIIGSINSIIDYAELIMYSEEHEEKEE